MSEKILFVDDDKSLLDGIRRELFEVFEVSTALGGAEGLQTIQNAGGFSVVVSDMRMPEMNGIDFLSKVKEIAPESIRVMLTGNTDLGTAISAVNEGNIFRFINKPCSSEILIKVIEAAIEQYHLVRAEKELLEHTFQGGINVLVEILSLTNPVAFSRARRVKYFVGKLANLLKLKDVWKFETAAMLSQIGCVTIPPDVIEKVYLNENLDDNEKEMLLAYPKVGHDLIVNIPRLDVVAKMIANQQSTFDESSHNKRIDEIAQDILGAQILNLAIDYDTYLSQGFPRGEILTKLRENEICYHPLLFEALRKILPPVMENKITMMPIINLSKGMVLENDIRTQNGILLAKKGQEVTPTMRLMLENHMKQKTISDSVLVAVPLKPKE